MLKALNGLLCADVPLRNYSLTHSHSLPTSGHTCTRLEHHMMCGARYSPAVCFW